MTGQARLYTPAGVALGTLLGSLAAGALLMWLNYRSLGNRPLARKVAAAGVGAYLLMVALASMLPNSPVLASVLVGLQTFLAYQVAESLQGDAVRWHVAQGGMTHPLAWAGGIGLIAGITVVVLLVLAAGLLGIPLVDAPANGEVGP